MGFCTKCGTALINGNCPNCTAIGTNTYGGMFQNHLMDPNEKIVCVLGNTYLQNFLSGGVMSNGFSVVSDKRVYFRGNVFESFGDKLRKRKITKAVNIRDVSGVSVTNIFPLSLLISGGLFFLAGLALIAVSWWFLLVGTICAGLCGLRFYLTRRSILKIEYAGGAIAFDIKWFSQEESLTYQKTLFLAKDKLFQDE